MVLILYWEILINKVKVFYNPVDSILNTFQTKRLYIFIKVLGPVNVSNEI